MSVVVMGMDYPKNCFICEFAHNGIHDYCTIEERDFDDEDFDAMERNDWHPDWCPLHPLPEKHGRLGDLDELQSSLRESVDECKKWIKELEKSGDNETLALANQEFCTFVEAALRLKSIPTIVEAEG